MGRVFFDLDGTLVDSKMRLYRLFRSLCPECAMTYGEYWKVKRGRISQAEFLRRFYGYDESRIAAFHAKWMDRVEDAEAVLTDIPVEGASELLASLSDSLDLYVLTSRQNDGLVHEQIGRFGWDRLFVGVLTTGYGVSKATRVLETVRPERRDILVGDTGEDVRCARTLGMCAVTVSWGILSPEILVEYKPDFLAADMNSLERYIKERTSC